MIQQRQMNKALWRWEKIRASCGVDNAVTRLRLQSWIIETKKKDRRTYLRGMIEFGESDSVVVDFELIDPVDVWKLEGGHEVSVDRDQSRADERIDADEF